MNAFLLHSCTIILLFCNSIIFAENSQSEYITIAILAKDKEHTLPLYLSCLEEQTWPKEQTYLYIRTNNNTDNTAQILRDWIERVGNQYAKIYFDDFDVETPVEQFGQHEWNATRFKVLGKIRQDSIDWAYHNNSHYFVVDCDNFIFPNTVKAMISTNLAVVAPMISTNLAVVAPMLQCASNKYYSNYHYIVDHNGYYTHSDTYYDILYQRIKGIIDVAVIHCTYFIQHAVLNKMCYDDESARYEYVIFSDNARKQNIAQYLDNRTIYGYISFAENMQEFEQEPFITKFNVCKNYASASSWAANH